MPGNTDRNEQRRVAEAVREACFRVAQAEYEQAAMSGLCQEGALEAALGAIRSLDLEKILKSERK